jgi:hypothetical protein
VDRKLRKAAGRIAEVRERGFEIAQGIRDSAESALEDTAVHLAESWIREDTTASTIIVHDSLVRVAAEKTNSFVRALSDLARELTQTLQQTAEALGFSELHEGNDLVSAIQEIPRLDLGSLQVHLQPTLLLRASKKLATRQTERNLRKQIGPNVAEAFANLGKMLDSWARLTLSDIQRRFELHADGYRAHLDRIASRGQVSEADEQALSQDLASLAGSGGEPSR